MPLRPLGLADILDGAFRLYRSSWRALVVVTAAVLVPVQLVSLAAQRALAASLDAAALTGAETPEQAFRAFRDLLLPSIPAVLATSVLGQWLLVLASGGICAVAAAAIWGRPVTGQQALAGVVRRGPALLGGWLVAHLVQAAVFVPAVAVLAAAALAESVALALLGVGLLLAAVPLAVAAMTLFLGTVPAIVVERAGPVAGLRRSVSLVRHRFWPALAVSLLAGLVAGLVAGAIGAVPGVAAALLPEPVGFVIAGLGGLVGALVSLPITTLVALLVYLDARIRVEGLDVAVLAAGLAAGAPGPP